MLILQFVIGCAGLLVSAWTVRDTTRTARALSDSRTNGPRWIITTGDLVDDWIRLALNLCIMVPTMLVWTGVTPNVYVWPHWRSLVLIVMTALLSAQAVNRYISRSAVMRSLSEERL